MIDGYRSVYDLGGAVTPQNQPDFTHARRAAQNPDQRSVSGVQPTHGVQKTGADSPTGVTQKDMARSVRAPQDDLQAARGGAGKSTSEPPAGVVSEADAEPKLPRLSAEALATALLTAEPDKAVVPRVLPTGWDDGKA